MATVLESKPRNTLHRIETEVDRAKFLRRIMREDGWNMRARASEDWQIVFERTIKGQPGDPDIEMTVHIEDKISVVGRWGKQRSFHDAEEVIVPKPDRCWLNYGSVQTVAKFLLEKRHFLICGSSGSTNSSKHGLAFVSLKCIVGNDHIKIGHQSVYVNGRMVCCGSVE